eukprot:11321-Amphidinium_carterae.3
MRAKRRASILSYARCTGYNSICLSHCVLGQGAPKAHSLIQQLAQAGLPSQMPQAGGVKPHSKHKRNGTASHVLAFALNVTTAPSVNMQ